MYLSCSHSNTTEIYKRDRMKSTFLILILLKLRSSWFSICCNSSIAHVSNSSPKSFLKYMIISNVRNSDHLCVLSQSQSQFQSQSQSQCITIRMKPKRVGFENLLESSRSSTFFAMLISPSLIRCCM